MNTHLVKLALKRSRLKTAAQSIEMMKPYAPTPTLLERLRKDEASITKEIRRIDEVLSRRPS